MNYDPNLTTSGKMANQTIILTFQQWEYKVEKSIKVGGNQTGLNIIDLALETLYEELPTNAYGAISDFSQAAYIELTDSSGDVLTCDDEELKGEEWLKEMLVKAEIVDIQPAAGFDNGEPF